MHFNSTGSGMFREIDTLALTRQLQKNDVFTEKQAEEAVRMFVSCLKSADFVTHAELQVEAQRNRHKFERYQMISDARIERANVKSETVEKDLKQEAEKIRSELRYNFEKMNQTSRLDLNLEKGRMQDNLTLIDNKLLSTELRLDREIQSMRTHLEIKVNDIIRYGLGTLVSVGALGLGFLRFLTSCKTHSIASIGSNFFGLLPQATDFHTFSIAFCLFLISDFEICFRISIVFSASTSAIFTLSLVQSKLFSYGSSISSAMMTGMHPTIIAWYALNVHGDHPLGHKQNVDFLNSLR
ncbi:unnamed protein product [Bathycoccus prasinos]